MQNHICGLDFSNPSTSGPYHIVSPTLQNQSCENLENAWNYWIKSDIANSEAEPLEYLRVSIDKLEIHIDLEPGSTGFYSFIANAILPNQHHSAFNFKVGVGECTNPTLKAPE